MEGLAEGLVQQVMSADGHGRQEGLRKLLVRSYSLKGRNTVVALGITVLFLQNMLLESSSTFHLLVLLQYNLL